MKLIRVLCLLLALLILLSGCDEVLQSMESLNTENLTSSSSTANLEPTEPEPTEPEPTEPEPTAPEATEPGPTDPDVPEVAWDQFDCITVAEALQIAQSHITSPSEEWYYVIATVTAITDEFYGAMMVADDTGFIYVYGSYSADGSKRYVELDPKPVVGDTVLLYGNLQNYNGDTKGFTRAYIIDFRQGSSIQLPECNGSQGLEYSFVNNSYIVSGIGTCTDVDIVIPTIYNGFPVTGIGYDAFYWVYSFDSVTIPSGVTDISACAFRYSSIKRIVLPEDLEKIPSSVFSFSELEEIVLPSSVKFIDDFAFYGCTNLRTIELHEGITHIGEFAFAGSGIEKIVIPKSVNQVSPYLCSSMNNLGEVILHDQIQQIGEGAFMHSTLPSITIPDSVTYIGKDAFLFCNSLKTVRFQGSAPYIYNNAFYYVNAEVKYPAGNATWNSSVMLDYFGTLTYTPYDSEYTPWLRFQLSQDGSYYILTGVDDLSLTDVVIPYMYDGLPVREISSNAFNGCDNIRSIQLPGGLQKIGDKAFSNCSSLLQVIFTGDLPSVSDNAFAGVTCQVVYPKENPSWTQSGRKQYGGNLDWTASDWTLQYFFDPVQEFYSVCGLGDFVGTYLVIPQYYEGYPVRGIDAGIFRYCQYLETVIISDLVKVIPAHTFADCPNLSEVTLPKILTTIEYNAFQNCVSLKEIHIPNKVKEIDRETFMGCIALEKISLSDKLTIIWDRAFYGCESLKEIYIPDSVNEILVGAFSGCSSLQNVRLPSGLTVIESCVFENCISLASIDIPDGVLTIGDSAFAYCPIRQIQLPSCLQKIGSYAFSHCAQLEKITFPATLTHIFSCAFEHCVSLSEMTFLGDKPYMPDGFQSPFENVVAIVYYPANNDTWVGMHSYLGDLTWIAKEDP